jgi:hypothetical protein
MRKKDSRRASLAGMTQQLVFAHLVIPACLCPMFGYPESFFITLIH